MRISRKQSLEQAAFVCGAASLVVQLLLHIFSPRLTQNVVALTTAGLVGFPHIFVFLRSLLWRREDLCAESPLYTGLICVSLYHAMPLAVICPLLMFPPDLPHNALQILSFCAFMSIFAMMAVVLSASKLMDCSQFYHFIIAVVGLCCVSSLTLGLPLHFLAQEGSQPYQVFVILMMVVPLFLVAFAGSCLFDPSGRAVALKYGWQQIGAICVSLLVVPHTICVPVFFSPRDRLAKPALILLGLVINASIIIFVSLVVVLVSRTRARFHHQREHIVVCFVLVASAVCCGCGLGVYVLVPLTHNYTVALLYWMLCPPVLAFVAGTLAAAHKMCRCHVSENSMKPLVIGLRLWLVLLPPVLLCLPLFRVLFAETLLVSSGMPLLAILVCVPVASMVFIFAWLFRFCHWLQHSADSSSSDSEPHIDQTFSQIIDDLWNVVAEQQREVSGTQMHDVPTPSFGPRSIDQTNGSSLSEIELTSPQPHHNAPTTPLNYNSNNSNNSGTSLSRAGHVVVVAEPAPQSLFECPVCMDIMNEPVITSCGHTYCRLCLERWMHQSQVCPMCSNPHFNLRPNHAMQSAISAHHSIHQV